MRKRCNPFGQIFVRRDIVSHGSVVELLIGIKIEVAGTGKTEDNGLFLAGFFALEGFVNGDTDCMAALRRGQDSFNSRKLLVGASWSA